MSELEELVQRLKNETSGIQNKSAAWRRFDDTVNAMSPEQRVWVSKQDSVVKAENAMMSSFLEYLFNQHREAFASVEDGRYGKLVEDYINAIQITGTSYVSRAEQLEKENKDLRERLRRLEVSNESVATDGAGCSRKENSDTSVRSDNDTRADCKNLELFQD